MLLELILALTKPSCSTLPPSTLTSALFTCKAATGFLIDIVDIAVIFPFLLSQATSFSLVVY